MLSLNGIWNNNYFTLYSGVERNEMKNLRMRLLYLFCYTNYNASLQITEAMG